MFFDNFLLNGRFPNPLIGVGPDEGVSSKGKRRTHRADAPRQRAELTITENDIRLLDSLPYAARPTILC